VLSPQLVFIVAILLVRAVLYALTIASRLESVAFNVDVRFVAISSRAVSIKFVHPVAWALHVAKKLLNCASSEHFAKSESHFSDFVIQTKISLVHVETVFLFVVAFFCSAAMSLLMPAAVQDFSINGSYASSTSSAVQFWTLARHNLVAQT